MLAVGVTRAKTNGHTRQPAVLAARKVPPQLGAQLPVIAIIFEVCYHTAMAPTSAEIIEDVERLLYEMAYGRTEFKNHLESKLKGGLGEFYKHRLAVKNPPHKWRDHWGTEADRLIGIELAYLVTHEIRGFKSRRKAFDEVVTVVKSRDMSFRRIAQAEVARDYQVSLLSVPIDDEDTEAFWEKVDQATSVRLAEFEGKKASKPKGTSQKTTKKPAKRRKRG